MTALWLALCIAPWLVFHAVVAVRARRFGGPAFPGPRPRLLRWGSLVPLLRAGLLDFYRLEAQRARDDVLVWVGVVPHLVVARPETAVQVLADREAFVREVAPTRHLFGGGMLRLEGEPWKERRAAFVPAFRRETLDAAVAVVQDESDVLVAEWAARGGAPVAPSRDVSFRMLRILGRFLFGFQFDRERHGGAPLHRALITLSTGSVARHLLPVPLTRLRGDHDERAARAWLDGVGREILRDGASTPFMDALREGLAAGTFDEQGALDELRTFLVAGHETSATAIVWTIALLAAHPEIQERVYEDVTALPPPERVEDVAALRYTTRVIQEAMRLYPPVPISISRTTRPVRIGARTVPADTLVDISSYVLHRDPDAWPDPDRFDPDRFEGASPIPGSYLPFLLGPHTCLGMRFAMLELPIVVAALVRAFHVTEVAPARVNLRLSLHPAGLRIAFTERVLDADARPGSRQPSATGRSA